MVNKDSLLPDKEPAFSWKKRRLSFGYAWKGMVYVFRTQHNMWIHGVAAVLAVIFGVLLDITSLQWVVILLCIGLVFALEMVNTAVELLADHLHPEQHPVIGRVKDAAAGAVLAAAIISFVIGCWIFGPGILSLF